MALEPNTTPYPNAILDTWMAHLNGPELSVVCRLVRYTFGWRNESGRATAELIQAGTAYDRHQVLDALFVLVNAGMARREPGPPAVFSLLLEGSLDVERLQRAREALAAKQRTSVPTNQSGARTPARVVLSTQTAVVAVHDGPSEVSVSETELIYPSAAAAVEPCLPYTEGQADASETAAAADKYKDMKARLLALGLIEDTAESVLYAARANGRSPDWIRQWIVEAMRRAENPAGFVVKMVTQNAELPLRSEEPAGDPYNRPVSPELKAKFDARANSEHERTRQECGSLEGYYRPTEADLEAAGYYEMKERIRSQIPAKMAGKAQPAIDFSTDENRQKLEEVRRELEARRNAPASRPHIGQQGPQRQNPGPFGDEAVSSDIRQEKIPE